MLNSIHELNDKCFCIKAFNIDKDIFNNKKKLYLYGEVLYLVKEKYTNHLVDDNITYKKHINQCHMFNREFIIPKNPTCTLKELRHKSVQDESHDFNTDMQRDPIHGNASTCDNHDDTDNSDTYTPSGIVSGAIGDCYSYFCFFIRL
ncbi:PIR Superfamily Protein [Plasmodium ovale curtisi]|uniref:PIR Superfamily Protein n=1 Tax=Plasmodium ovale curtisi TaxID=864141 RepID=A0A1A8WI40_PLAOA|nr:PIR Superfamily Protein [Plasmodium ovale curtisi]SBT00412.1 PIR Superfamily Protein [Plasmodium ovale curtisi]